MLATTLLSHALLAAPAPAPALPAPAYAPHGDDIPGAIDFADVDRTIEEEPEYVAEPRYGMFLFGTDADIRVWAVLDKSSADSPVYDVLYLDRDADGVLGEFGERLSGKVEGAGTENASAIFDIGDFAQPTRPEKTTSTPPGAQAGAAIEASARAEEEPRVHESFKLTWTKDSVRYRMMWEGETLTMGTFGPTRDTYASFGKSNEEATILVPGFDRPLEFERWLSGTLTIGGSTDFKVFVGARGSKQGAFSCGDDEFLPKGEYVLATLVYMTEDGDEKRLQCKLRERC